MVEHTCDTIKEAMTYLSNITIIISECPALKLIFRNDVKRKHGALQGYFHFNGTVNGKPSWRSVPVNEAIWFIPDINTWGIGPLNGIGKKGVWIKSINKKDEGLFNVPSNKWQYTDKGEWKDIKSGDISIICVKGNKDKNFKT